MLPGSEKLHVSQMPLTAQALHVVLADGIRRSGHIKNTKEQSPRQHKKHRLLQGKPARQVPGRPHAGGRPYRKEQHHPQDRALEQGDLALVQEEKEQKENSARGRQKGGETDERGRTDFGARVQQTASLRRQMDSGHFDPPGWGQERPFFLARTSTKQPQYRQAPSKRAPHAWHTFNLV